ncbi:MAG: glutathione S-transferase family protein [Rubrivivax sp.]
MITVYWSPKSRAVRMFWMLEEVGQPYALQSIDIRNTDPGRDDPPGFVEASPLRKVPALADGDVRVADSAAIAMYLADRYAAGDLAPHLDDPARGEFLTWLLYTPSALEPAMMEKFAKLPPNPVAYAWGSFDKAIGALETRLAHRQWLAADRFTMADLIVSGTVQTMVDFKILEPSAALRAYVERCYQRPAAVRAREKESAAAAALTG